MFEPYWKPYAGDIFAPGGSHLPHAETFSGTKIQALLTATECVPALEVHAWQRDPRHPEGYMCAAGGFDGLQAMPIQGTGKFQTLDTGDLYMRTFVNTEITSAEIKFKFLYSAT